MSYGLSVLVSDIPANNEVELPAERYFRCGDVDDLKEKQIQGLRDYRFRNLSSARGMGDVAMKLCYVAKEDGRQRSEVRDLKFRKTWDIIEAAERGLLPDKIMLNVHPQRWTDRPLPWVKEFVGQNVKNVIKRYIVKFRD